MTRRARWMARCGALALLVLPLARGRAQGTCEVNNQASCVIVGSAAQSVTVTVTKLARLSVPLGDIVLPSPVSLAAIETGFGAPATLAVEVRANTPWSLALSSGSATWSASPLATARQNKPIGELEWSLAAGGGYAALTQTPVTARAETLQGIYPFSIFFRARFDFSLDVPGAYTAPVTVLLTAP